MVFISMVFSAALPWIHHESLRVLREAVLHYSSIAHNCGHDEGVTLLAVFHNRHVLESRTTADPSWIGLVSGIHSGENYWADSCDQICFTFATQTLLHKWHCISIWDNLSNDLICFVQRPPTSQMQVANVSIFCSCMIVEHYFSLDKLGEYPNFFGASPLHFLNLASYSSCQHWWGWNL